VEIILNPSPDTIHTGTNLRSLLELSRRALFEPSRFFRYDLARMSVSETLSFGIGNAWVAGALAFFVQTFNTLITSQLLERWMQRMLASEDGLSLWGLSATSFLYSSGMLLLAPFLLLLRCVLTSVWLFAFAKLLAGDRPDALDPVTYKNVLRIQGAALTGHWFSVVPIFGGILSFVVSTVLTVTGVRERFGVSTRRAFAITVGPWLMLIFLLLLLVAVVLVGATQLPFEELLELAQQGD
jgi:hypothetical protein